MPTLMSGQTRGKANDDGALVQKFEGSHSASDPCRMSVRLYIKLYNPDNPGRLCEAGRRAAESDRLMFKAAILLDKKRLRYGKRHRGKEKGTSGILDAGISTQMSGAQT